MESSINTHFFSINASCFFLPKKNIFSIKNIFSKAFIKQIQSLSRLLRRPAIEFEEGLQAAQEAKGIDLVLEEIVLLIYYFLLFIISIIIIVVVNIIDFLLFVILKHFKRGIGEDDSML